MAAVDKVGRGLHMKLIFRLGGTAPGLAVLSGETTEGAVISEGAVIVTGAASASGRAVLPLMHDLLVGLLDLLEAGFRLVFVGIVDIGIRVIFAA